MRSWSVGKGKGSLLSSRSHKSSFESWIAATGRTRTRNARALCIVPAWIGVARHNSPSFPLFFCSSLRTSGTGNTPLLRQYTTLLFAIYASWSGKFFLAYSVTNDVRQEIADAGKNSSSSSQRRNENLISFKIFSLFSSIQIFRQQQWKISRSS